MPSVRGRAWTFGDDIDTDVLAPGVYMKLSPEQVARHCLEAVDPAFAPGVRPGDIVVAGQNFGMGSSREQAPQGLKLLGVGAVLAKSFSRIFYRNAFNLGLPALFFAQADEVEAGDALELDLEGGSLMNLTSEKRYRLEPVPQHLLSLIRDGGLMPQLERRIAERTAS